MAQGTKDHLMPVSMFSLSRRRSVIRAQPPASATSVHASFNFHLSLLLLRYLSDKSWATIVLYSQGAKASRLLGLGALLLRENSGSVEVGVCLLVAIVSRDVL